MRKVTFFCVIIGVILIAVPLIALCLPENNINTQQSSTLNIDTNTKQNTSLTVNGNSGDAEKHIISMAASLCDESFCDEGIKAVLAVVRNNYMYAEEEGEDKDSIPESEYSDEFYKRVKNLYRDTNANILYNNKLVYIPYTTLSCGYTKGSEEYPYITVVASPWDCLNDDFVYGKEYSVGISIEGINYFCAEYGDYKSALKWYLPLLSVT